MIEVNLEYIVDPPDGGWNDEPPLAEVLGSAGFPLYTTDAQGWLTYYNEAAADLWGCRPVLGEARWCGSWRIYGIDGSIVPHSLCPMAVMLRERRALRGLRGVLERPDGTRVSVVPYPTPLLDRSGEVVAGFNMLMPAQCPGPSQRSAGADADRV